ncbi:MAG: hypothetical protein S0880_10255 [Actinomycetota bacterium]|nr:hypothetical protein [Actinomycetota bacterium]
MEALDMENTSRRRRQTDRAVLAGARSVERLLHKTFYPVITTRWFDWPTSASPRSWRLWLDEHEVLSLTSLVSGGVTIPPSDYLLEPANDGPPYDRIEINLGEDSAFSAGATPQRAIVATGTFGSSADYEAATTTAEAVDASETEIDVATCEAVGTLDHIRVDTELMRVTGRSNIDTGQDIGADLDDTSNDDAVSVSDGTAFTVEETIVVDTERMRIADISGNTLTVERAVDGSTLAAHTSGADVYAPRRLTVARAALGTTATTHSSGATVERLTPPPIIEALNIAEAIVRIEQELAGYLRTAGSGEAMHPIGAGPGIGDLREQALALYGRRHRVAAV